VNIGLKLFIADVMEEESGDNYFGMLWARHTTLHLKDLPKKQIKRGEHISIILMKPIRTGQIIL